MEAAAIEPAASSAGLLLVGRGLPRYVERDFAKYLECGVLAHGFARVRCESCKDELLVAFSCKGRGVCPSCNAKPVRVLLDRLNDESVMEIRTIPLKQVDKLIEALLSQYSAASMMPAAAKKKEQARS